MNIAEVQSLLNVKKRSDKKLLEKLCADPATNRVVFHIDNIYVDSVFGLEKISSIEEIKRDFVVWIADLESQIRSRKLTVCGLPITVASAASFSYFSYAGSASAGSLQPSSGPAGRFEQALIKYLKEGAGVILSSWFILETTKSGAVVVRNTPLGIYKVTESLRPVAAAAKTVKTQAVTPAKGPATKSWSFKTKTPPPPPSKPAPAPKPNVPATPPTGKA